MPEAQYHQLANQTLDDLVERIEVGRGLGLGGLVWVDRGRCGGERWIEALSGQEVRRAACMAGKGAPAQADGRTWREPC